jgi:hypothetical protein
MLRKRSVQAVTTLSAEKLSSIPLIQALVSGSSEISVSAGPIHNIPTRKVDSDTHLSVGLSTVHPASRLT